MHIDPDGLLQGARYVPSPNCDERPDPGAIELLVIHNISLPPGEFGGDAVMDFFLNRLDHDAHPYFVSLRGMRVSAHFLIRRDGETIQLVPCGKRAWHAGESAWRGRSRCNDFSIGIELEGADDVPFADLQYERLAALTRALKAKYAIADWVGHADIAPGRKTDPGRYFDWGRYRRMIEN